MDNTNNNNQRPSNEESNVDGTDWRTQLSSDNRQIVVAKIVEYLGKHVKDPTPEGLHELKGIAVKFEEKIFYAATSREDYLRKISVKMISMENKPQSTGEVSSLPSNSSCSNQNPPDSGNQGKSLSIPVANNPSQASQQKPFSHTTHNSLASAGVQSSGNLVSALPSITGLTDNNVPNGVGQSCNLQNVSRVSQNLIGNSVGQGGPSNIFVNSQRQMQGRQHMQQVVSQQHPQQSQNSLQYMYQQQFQHQALKKRRGNIQPQLMQSHMQQQQQQQQQQNLLQPIQFQSSQQNGVQTSSCLHSNQNTLQEVQSSMIQSATQSGLLQNQQSSSLIPSVLQQHSQSVLRQQQSQHSLHQQQTPMSQQSMLSSQQKQQLIGKQTDERNLQENQLLGQPNNATEMQQQHQQQHKWFGQQTNISSMQHHQQQQVMCQQNDISSFHQQQMGTQSNVSGLKQQQQQVLGTKTGVSNMQTHQQSMHILQQAKVAAHQQSQQISSIMLSTQGQQPQSSRQQLMSQLQPQSALFQQQLGLEKHPSSLQRGLIQPQNVIGLQRVRPEASSTSADSVPPRGHTGVGDEQEEVYQKIKSMKEKYLPELSEMHKRISIKCQQATKLEEIDIYQKHKKYVERMINFLRLQKNNIPLGFKEKLVTSEKQILAFINFQTPKRPISSQQQFQLPSDHLSQSQITQLKHHDNQMNPQMQSNLQNSQQPMHQNALTSMQHGSMSSLSSNMGIAPVHPSMINTLQQGSVLELGQGNTLSTLQQGAVGGSIQKSTVNASQQANVNTLSQNIMNALPPTMIHHQHLKQHPEQHLLQTQQMKQHFQRQLMMQQQQQQQEQQILKQQHQQLPLLQQQHLQRQQKLQQSAQSLAQHMPQLHHQMSEVNDSKLRSSMGVNVISGTFQQHFPPGQHSAYNNQQQLKTGASFHISSPQLLQAASPQIPSPQLDQQSILTSLSKAGTPLQSANSPSIALSPSTPLASSPLPGKPEKQNSGLSSLSNAGNIGQTQTAISSLPQQAQSLAIATPGISASPLLEEFISQESILGTASTIVSEKSIATKTPTERLLQAVKSMSRKTLSASVNDIDLAISMVDRMAGPRPGYGFKASVGEDLVATTMWRLQARNFIPVNGIGVEKESRCHSNENSLNVFPSDKNIHDSFETSELESTATSRIKRCRLEINHALLEEISVINQRLINTVVDISDEDINSMEALGEGVEGTIVKCSFNPIALSPSLKAQDVSAQLLLSVRFLISTNYPSCSPIFLDKSPVKLSNEYENLLRKATSKFSTSLRCLSPPMSLGEMARTWDACAYAIVVEYAQQNGGGNFSSRYGTWENCINAA